MLWILICTVHLTVRSYNVTCAFQSESTFSSCLNVKELLARNSHDIWSLSGCNGIRTYDHLSRKRTLNHLAKLTNWLSPVASTYLYGVFDCMFLCHIRVSEWVLTLWLSECQGTPPTGNRHDICSLSNSSHLSVDSHMWIEHTVKCTVQISTVPSLINGRCKMRTPLISGWFCFSRRSSGQTLLKKQTSN